MESSTSFMVLKHVWAAPRQEVEKKRTGTGWILKFPGITVPLVSAEGSTVRLPRGQKVIEVTYEEAVQRLILEKEGYVFLDMSMYITIIVPWVIQPNCNVSSVRTAGGSFT